MSRFIIVFCKGMIFRLWVALCGTGWRVGLGKENREQGHAKIICNNIYKKNEDYPQF